VHLDRLAQKRLNWHRVVETVMLLKFLASLLYYTLLLDFNCQVGSRFFNVFKDFVDDNNLRLTEINRLNDVFTYCNDAGTATSWIDHVVCSSTVDSMTSSCDILYNWHVVLAPSWHALQSLLNVLHSQSILIDMSCNVNKTVCLMFKPKRQSSIIRVPSTSVASSDY